MEHIIAIGLGLGYKLSRDTRPEVRSVPVSSNKSLSFSPDGITCKE